METRLQILRQKLGINYHLVVKKHFIGPEFYAFDDDKWTERKRSFIDRIKSREKYWSKKNNIEQW